MLGTGPRFAAQGGRSGGCAIPTSAVAAEVSLAGLVPDADTFTRIWPANLAAPNATFLNSPRGKTLTNSGTVSVASGTGDSVIIANHGSVPMGYVLDVQGYYRSAG